MSEAAWMNLANILTAAAVLVGAITSFIGMLRAGKAKSIATRIAEKTDEQTVMIRQAKAAAEEAAKNTDGRLHEVAAEVKTARQETVDVLKEQVQLLAAVKKDLDGPTVTASGGRRADDHKPA